MIKEVERGAQWLDKEHPGWWNKVPTTKLYMDKCGTCVLGYVLGSMETFDKLFVRKLETFDWCISHGFNLLATSEIQRDHLYT